MKYLCNSILFIIKLGDEAEKSEREELSGLLLHGYCFTCMDESINLDYFIIFYCFAEFGADSLF